MNKESTKCNYMLKTGLRNGRTILVKWPERMKECIAANGRYFEKVTNSLNVDDEDDDSFYSGDE